MSNSTETKGVESKFSVFAEADGYVRPLMINGLTFARLMDDVVVPYHEKKPFFVDGAPLTPDKVRRLKIIRETQDFARFFNDYHYHLRVDGPDVNKQLPEQYHLRLEAMLRENGEDVTSQVIKAFDAKIRPSLKDYLPKREELIQAAMQMFLQAMKTLGS